jgi:penicillin amidase
LPGAINANLVNLMFADSVDEAVPIAQQSGIPHQNILLADKNGNAAWTVAGRMPARHAGETAQWAGFVTPDGLPRAWLSPADYPLVKNPADGRLWTANNRQMSGAAGIKIADAGFDLGARAQQIRDRLREKKQFDEAGLYAIQLDREARFIKHWAELLRAVAEKSDHADLKEMARQLSSWNGRADIDQVGYRLARAFRTRILDELWQAWIPAAAPELGLATRWDGRAEYPAWQAISTRAPHLLPKEFASWDAFLLAQTEAIANDIKKDGNVASATWGQRNTARIIHPFSQAIPALGMLLDMPRTPLPGDNHMPMVLGPNSGASERMVVAPGHEESGILTMPGGQSGHPLSPFYGAGHQDWLDGKPAPLLAGEARHTLRLTP